MMQNKIFQEKRYENWQKSSLSIVYMKEALEEFTDKQMRNLHSSIKTNLLAQGCLPIPPGCLCQNCLAKNIRTTGNGPRKKWELRPPCRVRICDKWLDEILSKHDHLPCPNIIWDNTNIQLLPVDHWEMAKVFQPYGCVHHQSSTDAGAAEILTLMMNCTHFHQFIKNPRILQEIKEIRNKTMHSKDMLMEDADMLTNITTILDLLTDPLHLCHLVPCQEAVIKIEQLRDSKIDMSLNRELEQKATIQHTAAIETDIQEYEGEEMKMMQDAIQKQNTNDVPKSTKEYSYSLPAEILRMDRQSIELYKQTLTEGKEAVHTIRVMVVGQFGVGKTVLTRRLLGKRVDIDKRYSTNGIDIRRCKVSIEDGEWSVLKQDDKSENMIKRLAKVIAQQELNKHSVKQPEPNLQGDSIESESNVDRIPINTYDVTQKEGTTPDVGQDYSTSMKPPVTTESDTDHHNIPMNEDIITEQIKALVKEVNNLKDTNSDYADLSIWDFAGQYAFYATHQVFLSWRAVYLLVTDISKPLHDVVKEDKCYLDSIGSKSCSISEFIEFWLNSIHEYCSNQEPGVPPVILVGTCADKLDQSKKEELSDQYFDDLRKLLMDKITFSHLVDADFLLDNAKVDPNLTELKEKIFKVASKQQYWGELIPARWITLERALVELRDKGLKVCERKTLLTISKELTVPLTSDEEIELFLRFHHDSGTILYYSHDEICDHILLDPQWLVNAFKRLITADMFLKKKPEYKQWLEFDKTGKLKQELVDIVWKDTEFSAHRDHLLKLLERLDIIARPRSFVTNEMRTKIDDFYFAPCVLKDPPPTEMFQPNISTTAISTSRLCFSMSNRALPVALFNRLMAACLKEWPVWKQNGKELIFCGCGAFDVERHRLTLFFSQNVIQIWVTNFEELEPNKDVCMKVRKMVEAALTKILKQIPGTCDLKTSFKCPDITNVRSEFGMFDHKEFLTAEKVACKFHDQTHVLSSAEILKYWNFKDACCEDDISEDIWKRVLGKLYPKFVSDMEPESVIDQFHELQFLPFETLRGIREKPTTSEKNRAILDTVLTKGYKGYEDFKECLKKTKQESLVSQLSEVENQLSQGPTKPPESTTPQTTLYVEPQAP